MLTSSGSTQTIPWFQPASFFLVRTPLLPAATFCQLTTRPGEETTPQSDTTSAQTLHQQREQCQQTILQRVQEPFIQQALAIASPSFGGPLSARIVVRQLEAAPLAASVTSSAPRRDSISNSLSNKKRRWPRISFSPNSPICLCAQAANVTLRPRLRQYEIAVGVTPSVAPENHIKLDDLVVGIRDNRFYLRSLRLSKEVRVCEGHMLNAQNAPNVCRFLAEIGRDARPMLTAFDWGRLAAAPFLPRVVSHQLVLSPARWNLTASTLAPVTEESCDAEKYRAVQLWRQRWHVPRYVYWAQADNRLLLDLEHPCTIDELFSELDHIQPDQYLTIQEMQPGFEDLWLDDGDPANTYLAEIVVPVVRTRASEAPLDQAQLSPMRPVERSLRNAYPGDEWVYMKLFCEPDAQNEVIVQHIVPF